MKTLLAKAFADLRANWRQALLAIVALVVGIWGVASVIVAYVTLTQDLRKNFMATRPAHAVLASPDFAALDLAALRARSEVESAELRDLSMQRIEVHPDEWIPLWLFGVEDFREQSLATIRLERGATVPPPQTMWIERDGKNISNLDLGAAPRVRAGSRLFNIPVSGIAFDPAQAPATQDHFIYAYVDKNTYRQIAGTVNQRLILRLRGVSSADAVRERVLPLLADMHTRGIRITAINVPNFEEHPHQWQLDTLLLLQGSIGFLAFLMGAVLVSQLMAALLARQVRQIGIMKAIGATRAKLLAGYALMVLALGVAAGAIAIPLALRASAAFSSFVAGKLNFDVQTDALPALALAGVIAVSVFLPLAAAWPTLWRGTGISVRRALEDQVATNIPSRTVATSAQMPPWLAIAIANALRQKRRLAITVLTMALGVAIFDAGFNVRSSLADLLATMDHSMGHDVQVVLSAPVAPKTVLPLFADIPNLQHIEGWNGGRGELQTHVVATSSGIGVVALPYDTALFRPRIRTGRWLRASPEPEIVLNEQAHEAYGRPALGATLDLDIDGKKLQAVLVGIIEELEKPKIYIDRAQYDLVFDRDHRINSLMMVAQDKRYDRVLQLKRAVEARIAASDLSVLYVMSQAERVRVIFDHLDIVLTVLVLLSVLVLLVGAMGMAAATAINIQERTREIGVMRATGATAGAVFRQFVTEGMLVCVASIILGLLLAIPLSAASAVFFGRLMLGEGASLRLVFSGPGLVVVGVCTLIFCLLASSLPARRAARVPTREALAYE